MPQVSQFRGIGGAYFPHVDLSQNEPNAAAHSIFAKRSQQVIRAKGTQWLDGPPF